MKKIFLTAAISFLSFGVACADIDRPIEVKDLPTKAQTFLKQHFSNTAVSLAVEDKEFVFNEYEVVLVNGAKMDFDSSGEWTEIDCKYATVPDAIVPKQILSSVAERYPDAKVLKIKRQRKGYEVSLSNRLELSFDSKFKVVDIDD